MTHPIESLFTSADPIVVEVAQSLVLSHDYAVLRSVLLLPVILGKFARDLGVAPEREEIGQLTEYSLNVTIKGCDCKLFSIGETPNK
jgi:hypothetical protein